MPKNDGGPAFPQFWVDGLTKEAVLHDGMSLRDWFAGQIAAGSLSSMAHIDVVYETQIKAELFAVEVYRLADAMLAERKKEPEHE